MKEMSNTKPIAHVSEDKRIHLLDEHLRGTAKLAERFAAEFGCGEWGWLARVWMEMMGKTP